MPYLHSGRMMLLAEAATLVHDALATTHLSVGWVAHTLRAQHRWAVLLSCTSWPRFSRHVVAGAPACAATEDPHRGSVAVLTGPVRGSSLRLPVVPARSSRKVAT